MTTHVMVDLETLGNAPATGVLLALGAQAFQLNDALSYPTAEEFEWCVTKTRLYYPIDIVSQVTRYQLIIEGETLIWWLDPCRHAQLQAFITSSYCVDVRVAFKWFMDWLQKVCPKQEDVRLWSHGVTYDCLHLAQKWPTVMQTSFDTVCPFRQLRDTRTLFAMYEEKFGRSPYHVVRHQQQRHHHPLEDAWVQACAVQLAIKELCDA